MGALLDGTNVGFVVCDVGSRRHAPFVGTPHEPLDVAFGEPKPRIRMIIKKTCAVLLLLSTTAGSR